MCDIVQGWVNVRTYFILTETTGNYVLIVTNFFVVVLPVMYPDFATQGFLWVPNLLMADSTLILPFIIFTSNILVIEVR